MQLFEVSLSEFDPDFYKSNNGDLASLTDAERLRHFNMFGQTEGREGSPLAKREAFLSKMVNRQKGEILEIGPFCSPLIHGENVYYLDVLDAAALRSRAMEHGIDPKSCPSKIDFVGSLSAVGRQFDAVVSSHSIEHQADLVQHLTDVANVLRTPGLYYLIIPDKRYCFDALLPTSTIADVLQAHREGRTRHTFQNVIEHRALTTHNDAVLHWQGVSDDPRVGERCMRILEATAEYDEASGSYIDVHAWKLTPAAFREIVQTLSDLKMINLSVVSVFNTPINRLEFCAILKKD